MVRKIVGGDLDGRAGQPVAKKFLSQGFGIVLQMVEHVDRAIFAIFNEAQSGIRRMRKYGQSRQRTQIGGAHLRVA